jgi:cystathionine beta-lyase/cystathionine gamma-synthase
VYYPGLSSSDDQEIIKKQLLGCSGLLAFELKDASFKAVKTVINNLKIFKIGVSWGSFESLVMSPNYGYNTADLKKEQLSEGLIRLSIGLESTDDLIRDLEQSLERI